MNVGAYAVVIGCAVCAGIHAALSRRIAATAWVAFGRLFYGKRWTKEEFIRRYVFLSAAIGGVILVVAIAVVAQQ